MTVNVPSGGKKVRRALTGENEADAELTVTDDEEDVEEYYSKYLDLILRANGEDGSEEEKKSGRTDALSSARQRLVHVFSRR